MGKGLGYLGQGDAYKGMGDFQSALQAYTNAIDSDEKAIQQGLMKRGLLHMQMKDSKQALSDFTRLSEEAEKNPSDVMALCKAYFHKAKALKRMGNCGDSLLYFEQVVR